jgi:hypothetical protein
MNRTQKFCALFLVSVVLSACEPGTGASIFPNVTDIVVSSMPRALSGGRSSGVLERAGVPLLSRASCSSYASNNDVFSCAVTSTFPTSEPSDNLASWFLVGINILDSKFSALAETYNGLSPICERTDPVMLQLEVDSTTVDSFSSLSVLAVPVYFNCYYGDELSWGKKDGEKYLMHRSFGEGGSSAGTTRLVTVAKISESGNEVEAWMLVSSSTVLRPSIARLKANKVTGAFAYEQRLGHNDAYFKQMYLRTAGDLKMYFTALDASGGAVTVNNCVSSRDYTSTMSGCTSDGLATFPISLFTVVTLMPEVTSPTSLYNAMDAIVKIDMEAFGVSSGAN